jgi:cysteinyl-tRNA synthetase
MTVERIEELICLRDKARLEKHWQEADRIRDQLNQQGVVLEDTAEGTMWKIK